MKINFLLNKNIVAKFPILSVFLLEGANIQQIWRMWSEETAAGQSLSGWILVWLALIGWCHYYKVCVPWETGKWAFRTTAVGVGINSLVIGSVIYWRYCV